jgi:hypothetical protein
MRQSDENRLVFDVLSVVMVAVMVLSFIPVKGVAASSKDWKLFS